MRCACNEHALSSSGGSLLEMFNSRVGCRPVGRTKPDTKVCERGKGWCRAGKENSVGEGLVFSPRTVRKPPSESSSTSLGFSTERMPISMRESGRDEGLERERDWVEGGKKAVSVRAWEMVSKSISRVEAERRASTRGRQVGSEGVEVEREGQSLWDR